MKLYWSPRSPFVRKVMVFAHETGLASRIETVKTPVSSTAANRELMRVNPLGKIPTLVTDDGKVLFDSYVICDYLDGLHTGAKLIPQSPDIRWQTLRGRAHHGRHLAAARRRSAARSERAQGRIPRHAGA